MTSKFNTQLASAMR